MWNVFNPMGLVLSLAFVLLVFLVGFILAFGGMYGMKFFAWLEQVFESRRDAKWREEAYRLDENQTQNLPEGENE